MSNTIQLKRSNVSGRVPTVGQLAAGEVAINTSSDKSMFFGTGTDVVQVMTVNGTLPMQYANVSSGSLTTTVSGLQVLDSIPLAQARSIEYTIQGAVGGDFQVTKILVLHDDITPSLLEFGNILTGSPLFTIDVAIVTTNLVISINCTNVVGTYSFVRTILI